MTNKMKKVDEVHPYSITAPSPNAKKQLWKTRVVDESKAENRRYIKASSLTKLYDKLYDFYALSEPNTLSTLFDDWIDKRKSQGLMPKTIQRNREYWNKYYEPNPIIHIPLDKLDAETIEDFFHATIVEHALTRKGLNNMKLVLVDMIRLATVRKLIPYNPCQDIRIKTHACLPQKKKSHSEQIFHPYEINRLFSALNKDLDENPDCTDAYAIFLLFKLGLRISEIVAIKDEDIDFENNELFVHRMETRIYEDDGKTYVSVVNHTKKKSETGSRYLPLSDYELEIIRKVQEVNEEYGYSDHGFLFCDADGRTKCSEIYKRMCKVCQWADIQNKSCHTIRRTVATKLYELYNDIYMVKDFLGHSDVNVTWTYVHRSEEKQRAYKKLNQDVKGMNGLRGPKGSHVD